MRSHHQGNNYMEGCKFEIYSASVLIDLIHYWSRISWRKYNVVDFNIKANLTVAKVCAESANAMILILSLCLFILASLIVLSVFLATWQNWLGLNDHWDWQNYKLNFWLGRKQNQFQIKWNMEVFMLCGFPSEQIWRNVALHIHQCFLCSEWVPSEWQSPNSW